MTYVQVLAVGSAFVFATPVYAQESQRPSDPETLRLEARADALVAEARAAWNAPVADPNSPEAKNYGRAMELRDELSQSDRDAIVRQYEVAIAQRIGAESFDIKQATYFPQGSNFVVCGKAVFVKHGVRVPTDFSYSSLLGIEHGVRVDATEAQLHALGCDAEARVDLTR